MNDFVNFKNILNQDLDLSKWMSEEHKIRVSKASTFSPKLMEMIAGMGEFGQEMPWESAKNKFIFREQELTIWSGFKGHGKSLVLSQIVEKFISERQKVFIISPEFPPHRVLHRMMVQSIGVANVDPNNALDWLEAVDDLLWLYDQQSSLRPLDVIALSRYAVDELGVNHIVVDSLMKCGIPPDDYAGQKKFVDYLQQVAHRNPVHIHLIAHARKGADDHKIAGLHDIKGASDIADLAENIIVTWRNKAKELDKNSNQTEPDCVVKIEAQRNGNGDIFSIPLFFDRSNFTFVERQ